MQEPHQSYNSSPKNHQLRWILLGIAGIALVAASTFGILHVLKPVSTNNAATQESQTANAEAMNTTPSAKDTIAKLATDITDKHIAGDSPSVTLSEGSQMLYVPLSSTFNYIDVANDAALHISGLSLDKRQTATAVAALTKQLASSGYGTSTPKLPSVASLFTSKNSTCQLSTYSGAEEEVTAIISVLCADLDSYQPVVTKHLALLKEADVAKDSFSYTQTATASVENQEALLISTFIKDNTVSGAYIYGKQGDSWQYVGNSTEGTPVAGTTTEKFIINADIKKGTENTQYGKAVALLVGGR